jgi:Ca-activated chloride channel family protein
MKKLLWVLFFCLLTGPLFSQYYLRGEIKDERGRLLEGVRINLASRGSFPFYSGNGGTFGIPLSATTDTITLTLDGYETLKRIVDAKKFQFPVENAAFDCTSLYKKIILCYN